MILRGKNPIPVHRDLSEAGRYLQIPVLEVVLHPDYGKFLEKHPTIDLHRDSDKYYREIMSYAITHKFDNLFHYTLNESKEYLVVNTDMTYLSVYYDRVSYFDSLSNCWSSI